jgi:hypothetical protein
MIVPPQKFTLKSTKQPRGGSTQGGDGRQLSWEPPVLALFELRSAENTSTLPDAHVTIEPDGLYFCINGEEGTKALDDLLLDIERTFGAPQIEKL